MNSKINEMIGLIIEIDPECGVNIDDEVKEFMEIDFIYDDDDFSSYCIYNGQKYNSFKDVYTNNIEVGQYYYNLLVDYYNQIK